MAYSGAQEAQKTREDLSKALQALQSDSELPPDVLEVTQNIAGAVGALFEAQNASSERDGKSSVKSALGTLSQTLALLQDVKSEHNGIGVATEAIAGAMSKLYPLSSAPTRPPGARLSAPPAAVSVPAAAKAPRPSAAPGAKREEVEVNIGATTESNFYVGFSGEISEGGVFLATYDTLAEGTLVNALVTLPGGFETKVKGHVRFVRDSMDFDSEAEPGIGIQFESLDAKTRELVMRFIKKRPPLFFDD